MDNWTKNTFAFFFFFRWEEFEFSQIIIFCFFLMSGQVRRRTTFRMNWKSATYEDHQDNKSWTCIIFLKSLHESSFRYTISHTWELIVFRIELEELRSLTEEISRWKPESTSSRKKIVNWTKLKYWMTLLRDMTPNFSISNLNWSSWISNCNPHLMSVQI